jgi:hypothetical protein
MKIQKPADQPAKPPENIVEFNQITGLVFAQLYAEFPSPVTINRSAIANALGAQSSDWSHRLPSGKTVGDQIAGTIGWLNNQHYITSFGSHPAEYAVLTKEGLAALNAVPQGLSATVGSSLVNAASDTQRDWSKIGDLVGGALGGFTKSITG